MGGLFGVSRYFAVTLNGRIHAELKARRGEAPVPDQLAGFLDRLDGTTRFALSLWELPPATAFDRVKFSDWPAEYLQAAGRGDRMTVEIRRGVGPTFEHLVVGKTATAETAPHEEVRWDAFSTRVYRVELFTSAEAVPLFLSYWQTGQLPDGYRLRELDLRATHS